MKAKIKVLIVSEYCWPEGGGGILASHLIARILKDAGFKLTVVHGTRKPETIEGIDYIYTSLLNVRDKYRLWLNLLPLSRQSWFLKAVRRCDIVYIPRYCYPLISLAKKLGKKVVVHLHDYQPISYNATILHNQRRKSLGATKDIIEFELLEHHSKIRALLSTVLAPVNRLSRTWISEADKVICVSRRQYEIVKSVLPELADKMEVIYNPPPNAPMIEKKLERPTFIYLGGESYVKGFHVFLKASRKLLEKYPNVRFLLTQRFRNSTMSAIKGLGKAYDMLGYLEYKEVLKLHSITHALLFPSIWEEPLPYAVIEAMLMGTISIASKVGGVPEIVGGTYAEKMLFEPGNVGELVGRMESVLTMSSEQIVDIGHRLREAVLKKFNPEVIKRELIKVFSAE